MQTAVIHACRVGSAEVLATNELVFEYTDPGTSRVGLRPWTHGKPNPGARVLWAQQNVEPRDWLY